MPSQDEIERMLREQAERMMLTAVRVRPDGRLDEAEERRIVQTYREHAAESGYRVRDDWRLEVSLHTPTSTLKVRARHVPSGRIADASTPEAWYYTRDVRVDFE